MKTEYKKGDILIMSRGEYSDYDFDHVVIAIEDFCLKEQSKLFLESGLVWIEFGGFLLNKGLVERVNYEEIHIGCYGFELLDEINNGE